MSAWKVDVLGGPHLSSPLWENTFSVNNSTKDLSDKGVGTAVLSVGATEQCGPHLSLNLDTLVAEYYARAWGEVLDAYVLPTVPFNTSEEHASFKGTVSLGPSTVMIVLEEVVEGLRAQGFSRQVLTVGHGGSLWVGPFVKHVNRRFEDTLVVDAHRGAGPVWDEALRRSGLGGRGDVHGGGLRGGDGGGGKGIAGALRRRARSKAQGASTGGVPHQGHLTPIHSSGR